jgi:hypothetical protein
MLLPLLAATPVPTPAPDAEPLAIPTFILAVLGFVGAVVALVWQFATFRLSGPRIRVEVHVNGHNATRKLFYPVRPWWQRWGHDYSPPDFGMGESIHVKVRSIGRMPVVITDCVLHGQQSIGRDIYQIATTPNIDGESFPARIDPGDFGVWKFSSEVLNEHFIGDHIHQEATFEEFDIHAVVATGDGRDYRTRHVSVPVMRDIHTVREAPGIELDIE